MSFENLGNIGAQMLDSVATIHEMSSPTGQVGGEALKAFNAIVGGMQNVHQASQEIGVAPIGKATGVMQL